MKNKGFLAQNQNGQVSRNAKMECMHSEVWCTDPVLTSFNVAYSAIRWRLLRP
jgi:hypothetical protein